ncbi:MAG TPA: 30S ribosomal protein THX [Gemmatimonadales bacterium]|jgi:30S ribosomal protein S31|nr:30S ribosomal protein THX [Gemmatimonadales bacterium]
MGKGDLRSRRGKLYRGTYGNTRPKPSKKRKLRQAKQGAPPAPPPKSEPR